MFCFSCYRFVIVDAEIGTNTHPRLGVVLCDMCFHYLQEKTSTNQVCCVACGDVTPDNGKLYLCDYDPSCPNTFCRLCLNVAYNCDTQACLGLSDEGKPFFCIICHPPEHLLLLQEWARTLNHTTVQHRGLSTNNNSATLIEVKNHILYLGDSLPRIQDGQVLDNTVRSFCSLLHLSCIFSVTLGNLIMVKMGNNRKKYPVDLCLKSQLTGYTGIPKYTSYSKKTLIGRDCELNLDVPSSSNMTFSQQKERLLHDLPLLSDGVKQFAAERNWLDKYTWHYTSLSLSAEYGELAETVKNSGDSDAVCSMNQRQRSSILSEIADVAIFLLHVVRICDLNVTTNLRCTSD